MSKKKADTEKSSPSPKRARQGASAEDVPMEDVHIKQEVFEGAELGSAAAAASMLLLPLRRSQQHNAAASASAVDLREDDNHIKRLQEQIDADNAAGRFDKAALALKDLESIYRARSAEDPHNKGLSDGLASTLHNLGVAHNESKQYALAIPALKEAESIRRARSAEEHDNKKLSDRLASTRDGLAIILNNLGVAHSESQQYALAIPALKEAESIYRARSAEESDNKWLRDGLANTLYNLGFAHNASKQYALAIPVFKEAESIHRARSAEEHDNKKLRDGLANTLNNLGVAHNESKQYALAIPAFKEAESIRRARSAEDPDNKGLRDRLASTREGLAITLNNIGFAHNESKQYALAIPAFKEAESIRRARSAEDPDNKGLRDRLATTLHNLGVAHNASKQHALAISAFEEALTIHTELFGKQPDARNALRRGNLHTSLGNAYREQSLALNVNQGNVAPQPPVVRGISPRAVAQPAALGGLG